MNEEVLKSYEELKRNRGIISTIEPDFFFKIVDYLLQENEELKMDRNKFKKALGRRITYCNELEKDLFENCNNYVISKQKIKDKIEELKEDKDSKYYDIFLEERDIENTIKILQELLDNRK